MSMLLDLYLKVRKELNVAPLVDVEDLDLIEIVREMDVMVDIPDAYNELFERVM